MGPASRRGSIGGRSTESAGGAGADGNRSQQKGIGTEGGMRTRPMLGVENHNPAIYADWEMVGFGCSRETGAADLFGSASREAQVAALSVALLQVAARLSSMAQGRCHLAFL